MSVLSPTEREWVESVIKQISYKAAEVNGRPRIGTAKELDRRDYVSDRLQGAVYELRNALRNDT